MPNDAKLGLVAGVAMVVLIAALFFRRDAQAEPTLPGPSIPGMPASKSNGPILPVAPRLPSANDSDLPPPPVLPESPLPGSA